MLNSQARQLLGELLLNGPLSRSQLARNIGVSQSVVTRLSQQLIETRFITEGEQLKNLNPGRRAIELRLRSDQHYVVGFAINSYQQTTAIADLTGKIIATREVSRQWKPDAGSTLSALSQATTEILTENAISLSNVLAVGVACAGQVDETGRKIVTSPDIGWYDVPVVDQLERELGLPVFVESMQNALNVTECKFGKARGARNTLLISVALGIGSSFMVNGTLLQGTQTSSPTIGHVPVHGIKHGCNCGRLGCLATVASGFAILRELGLVEGYSTRQPHPPEHASLLFSQIEQLDAGDESLVETCRTAGLFLGETLKTTIAVTSPETILLWGPVAQQPAYLAGVESALRPNDMDPFGWNHTLIVSDTPLEHAAARLALDRYVFLGNPRA